MNDVPPAPPSARVASIAAVVATALAAVAVCGWLGLWQWDRAHTRAASALVETPAPLDDIISPSTDATGAIGRTVSVTGTWSGDVALVPGREIDGVPSVLMIRALRVPAGQTGTGSEATLAVLVGSMPADGLRCEGLETGMATVTGYLRASEPPPLAEDGAGAGALCGARTTTVLSVAELAQTWPGPMYSALLVSDAGVGDWSPLPAREPVARLNLQSLAYAAEWWAFGVFAVVLAFRWVRDNTGERAGQSEGVGHG